MKKRLKITEKQAELLGLNKVNEEGETGVKTVGSSVGPKPIRVIIFGDSVATKNVLIIKAINRVDSDAKLAFYPATGKIVGTISEYKWDTVKREISGIDPNISIEKKSLNKALKEGKTIKLKSTQFKTLIDMGLITESDINGGLTRVDKSYKKNFASSEIKNFTENEFKVETPNSSLPSSVQGKFNQPMLEDNGFKSEVIELIKYLYRKSEDLSPYWEEHGVNYDDICKHLLDKKIIISKNGKYELSKALGTAEEAKSALENALKEMVGEDAELETEASNYAPGTENDPNSPWNKKEPEYRAPAQPNKVELQIMAYNDEIAIFKSLKGNLFVVFYDNVSKDELAKYAEVEQMNTGNDEEGQPSYEYSDDFEINGDVLQRYVNGELNTLTKGVGLPAFEKGVDLVKIDNTLKTELLALYDKNKDIVNVLGAIKETTTSASSGAFTGPLSTIKKEMPIDSNELEVPVVGETTTSASSGQYTAPAFAMKKNHTDFAEVKPKAFKTTQYSGGGFVKFNDCTKLNNKTSGTGCSQGAVDNVVKVAKTKGNVSAPSLSEAQIVKGKQ